MDRVIDAQPKAWVLKPDGWITAEVDIHSNAWFFLAHRIPVLPMCVLNEIALQPCGWLAAYLGSALKSKKDLRFRNLGGQAKIHQHLTPGHYTLTTRARLTQTSTAGDMIIEQFDFKVLLADKMVYEGTTNFGFFTRGALASQAGIREPAPWAGRFLTKEDAVPPILEFEQYSPEVPVVGRIEATRGMAMPATALRMIDRIDAYDSRGGPEGLGDISGSKPVDSTAWFFQAHFFQDPVCPGSLGLESLIQLMKYIALDRWASLKESHVFSLVTDAEQKWTYRGQITPENSSMDVRAIVTHIQEAPFPEIHADGYLYADGRCIYRMENFGIRLIPFLNGK
jgi:3-hydroxymyristoyl/3-hydroxydecanoyl-(acyl carrier protein) dehydratase